MNSRGVYFGIASNIVGNSVMLFATLLLTRLLSPAEFGEFRVGANFAVLMVPFKVMELKVFKLNVPWRQFL